MLKGRLWIVALLAAVLPSMAPAPAEAVVVHPSLVPEAPARGYPVVLGTPTYVAAPNDNCTACVRNREVLAAHQTGTVIVAGGNFVELLLTNGQVVQQRYLAAWDIGTKQPVCLGQFTLDGIVRDIIPGTRAGTAYISGDFTRVTGANGVAADRSKIALVDFADCSVDPTFTPSGADGMVTDLVLSGNRLFVGGDFTAIDRQQIRHLAELDPITGRVRQAFKFTFGTTSLPAKIRGLGVTPDGGRLIFGGRFGTVSDGVRNLSTQVAIADITGATPRLTAHTFRQTHPENGVRPFGYSFQEMSVSEDGTLIGLAFGTATVSDYGYLLEAADRAQPVRWRKYLGDTVSGVAVTNNAVYFSGHFCMIQSGPGATDAMSPKMFMNSCTGSSLGLGAWRSHVAAVSLADGTPFRWNPGADSGFGGTEITITERGLLMGFDGQRVNDYRTGALGFLDFGVVADTTLPSDVTVTAPAPGATVQNPVRITGTATDNQTLSYFRLRITAADGRWLQPNGSLSTTLHEFRATATNGAFSLDVTAPHGSYAAAIKATDAAGNSSSTWRTISFVRADAPAPDDRPGNVAFTSPAPGSSVANPVRIQGVASDDRGIASYRLRITGSDGRWVQADGSLAATLYEFRVNALNGAFTLELALAPGTYSAAAKAIDTAGNPSAAWTAVNFNRSGG